MDARRMLRLMGTLALALVVLLSPAALADERKRHRDQGNPPMPGPTGGDRANAEPRGGKDRKDDPPVETADQQLARLSRALRSKDAGVVRAAFAELHRLETASARDLLTEFVKSSRDDRLKADGLLALGWRGNRAAVDFLSGKHGAISTRSRVAAAGCRAVGAVGDVAARPLLLDRLREEDVDDAVVAGALAGLVSLDVKAADLPALLRLYVAHESAAVRVEVAVAMGEVDVERWRDHLAAFAADSSADVRLAACDALGRREDEASVGVLMKLQKDDPDKAVREAALRAMLRIDDAAGE